jgi:hypothetical protein
MSDETYKRIVDGLKGYKIRKFCPYFENEPLLDKELFTRIKYAVEKVRPEWVELSTNLALLDETSLAGIQETIAHVSHELWISFHGISKETYEEIMGLEFEKSLHNVIQLIELSQKVPLNIVIKGSGEPLFGAQNGNRRWFDEKQFYDFWNKTLIPFQNKPKLVYLKYHDRAGANLLKAKGIHFVRPPRDTLNGFYCDRFDRWVHFLYNGEPVLCCMDYGKETGFGKTVREKSVAALYEMERYIEFLRKGTGLVESDADFICKRCSSPGG